MSHFTGHYITAFFCSYQNMKSHKTTLTSSPSPPRDQSLATSLKLAQRVKNVELYVFDMIYVSRDLDIQSMAVDMTNRHHVRENGRSFNSVFEVTKSVNFSRFCCILFYVHLLHMIITYSEDMVELS